MIDNSKVSVADVHANADERARIWEAIEKVAMGVLCIRGISATLGPGWKEHSTRFDDFEIFGDEATIEARFYDTRDSDRGCFTFPASYLETDYRSIEQAALAEAEMTAHAEQDRRARLQV